uniref:Uncharacterized protein n=1 Tax=Chenopodium quinoa TaxID=63459 RepID=A0A803MWY1_CHEQI
IKPEYTPLDKLSPITKAYKVRVTVIEKSQIRSPSNIKRFRKLVFKDDEGNSMKATLFGDECDHFKKVFEHKKKSKLSIELRGLVLPEYIPIADVPKTSGPEEGFGVVVHMEDVCQVTYKSGRVANVRGISIVDESTGTRPMIISAWGQLATLDCEILKDWASVPWL